MDPGLFDEMREAGGKFCKLDELHEKVGERIAGLLEVEAAYVTASAASGLVLTTAACMAGTDPERIARLPDSSGMRSQVVIQRLHRIGYDQAIRLAGATLVVVDDGEPPLGAMGDAVGGDTAAIFCMAHRLEEPGSLRIEDFVALSRESGVPLVVDAASECPPMSTLTRFSREGADLVIFSGGKSLLGPQSTGLVVGRPDLIAACAANGNPFATVGRPMKVSREEVIGFLKALESYLAATTRRTAPAGRPRSATSRRPSPDFPASSCSTWSSAGPTPSPCSGCARCPGQGSPAPTSSRPCGPGTVMSGDACDCSGFSGMAQKRSLATADIPLPGLGIRPTENRRDSGGLRDSSDAIVAEATGNNSEAAPPLLALLCANPITNPKMLAARG